MPNATDASGVQSFTPNYEPGSDFPVGTREVIYTATDVHGNMAECRFDVNVIGKNIEGREALNE